ncbi:hypothetical protein [Nocardia sp. bgisy118]|uniref:hypothetical protein n=1 Tax=Nocardia sp. bgisy118 TaxID=3413786 RepID=UPI003F4A6754
MADNGESTSADQPNYRRRQRTGLSEIRSCRVRAGSASPPTNCVSTGSSEEVDVNNGRDPIELEHLFGISNWTVIHHSSHHRPFDKTVELDPPGQ